MSGESFEPIDSEATKTKRKVSVVDAVCCVYFCAAAKSPLLIAILTALDMDILIPEEVVTEAGQKSFENLATHLARLKASARVKILPRLMLEDERTDVLANVARVRGMSQALAISSRKDLGRQSSSGTPSIWLTRVTLCMSSSTTKEPVGAFPACGHPLDVAAGGSGPIVWMHAGSVVLIGVGIAAALVFGDRRALLRSMRRLFGVDRRDTRWLRDRLRDPADRGQEPAGSPRLARRSRRVEREVVPGDPSAVGRRGLAPSGAAFNVHRPR